MELEEETPVNEKPKNEKPKSEIPAVYGTFDQKENQKR